VHAPVAVEALREVTDAVRAAGAVPVVHCCAADVPVALLQRAGAAALSFDVSLLAGAGAAGGDAWAEAFEAGVDLWPGIVPGTDPGARPSAAALTSMLLRFVDGLGLALDVAGPRLVLTPACGLAGASPAWSRQAMRLVREVAELVTGESD
jgi:hypothetical protein